MKKSLVMILTVVLVSSWNLEVKAQNNGVNGLLLGAGGGALIGQAIGRNSEATLIGTAVGGMLGYIVGNERDKHYVTQVYTTTYRQPRQRSNSVRWRENRRYDYSETVQAYVPEKVCRETEMLATINGRPETIFGTACLENGTWVTNRAEVRRHHSKYWRLRRYAYSERGYSRSPW